MIEKIIWADHVRNEEVLLRVKEQRNILTPWSRVPLEKLTSLRS
jgi:hypothetical protein